MRNDSALGCPRWGRVWSQLSSSLLVHRPAVAKLNVFSRMQTYPNKNEETKNQQRSLIIITVPCMGIVLRFRSVL